jgi:two-component system, OmpR family, response regulator
MKSTAGGDGMWRVLVVDHEPPVSELLADTLDAAGFAATAAYCAEEAHLLLRHERFDAALVDVSMPGESGTDLAEWLTVAGVPVILITGNPKNGAYVRPASRPCLHKPFGIARLVETLTAIMDTAVARRQQH